MNFKIILAFAKLIEFNFLAILIILSYKPTKNIILQQLKKEVENFHSNHIVRNYKLSLANLNQIENLREAILTIKAEPEGYINIPKEDVNTTGFFLHMLNNYKSYQKWVLFTLGLILTIEFGISVGLSLL